MTIVETPLNHNHRLQITYPNSMQLELVISNFSFWASPAYKVSAHWHTKLCSAQNVNQSAIAKMSDMMRKRKSLQRGAHHSNSFAVPNAEAWQPHQRYKRWKRPIRSSNLSPSQRQEMNSGNPICWLQTTFRIERPRGCS